jgi:hypothetical protein
MSVENAIRLDEEKQTGSGQNWMVVQGAPVSEFLIEEGKQIFLSYKRKNQKFTILMPGRTTEYIRKKIESIGSVVVNDIIIDAVPLNRESSFEIEPFRERERFIERLLDSFESLSVEDGEYHPAEEILDYAITRFPRYAPEWINAVFNNMLGKSRIPANILLCLGRLDYTKVESFIRFMVFDALKESSLELRQNALKAIDMFGVKDFSGMLRHYLDNDETEDWLSEYGERVWQNISSSL